MNCPKCQAELPAQAKFCPQCGIPVANAISPAQAGAAATGGSIANVGNSNINIGGGVQGDVTITVSPSAPPAAPGPQEKPGADPRLDYLNALIGDCNRLRLSGLDPTASDPTRARPMTLDQVYIGLDTHTLRDERDEAGRPDEEVRLVADRERKPLSALEAISRAPRGRLVLLGQPGSGKSTLARYLALRLAQALAWDGPGPFDMERYLPGWELGTALPVVIALGRLAQGIPAQAKAGTADMVMDYVRSDALNCYGCGEWVAAELERARALVILDGLDEVPAEKRERVQQAVRRFADTHPDCVCVVTCRTFSYTRDPGWQLGDDWPASELAPFDSDKINHFIAAWYAALTQLDATKKAAYDDKAARLRAALAPADARRLYQLAGVPLLLTVMAAVHTHENELPGSRALIYDKCVGLLLERWASERTPGAQPVPLLEKLNLPDRILLDKALWEVAFRAHESDQWRRAAEKGAQPALVTEGLLKEVMERWLRPDLAATFVEYCRTSNGLLMASGKTRLPDSPPEAPMVTVYTFPHLTFEEFLAARHLHSLGGAMPGRAAELAADVRWREVILFLIEYLCATGNDWQAAEVLKRLCPKDEPDDAGWRSAWLAGEGLPALRRVTTAETHDAELDERIVHRLAALVAQGRLLPPDRAAAGRTLSALGDPRPGVIFLPSPTRRGAGGEVPSFLWADLPSGTLKMGSRKGETFQTPGGKKKPYDDELWPDGKPRAVPIKAFKLAAYPLTVAQFRPFVQDPRGWANDKWWTKEGLKDRSNSRMPPLWDDPQWHIDNHPVVGVTWHAAVAYCRWLTARLRASGDPQFKTALVRLPAEAEWEWAARGPEGRRWPWGNDWRTDACNSDESKIGRTSAVGMFPNGANWTGNVFDLAGNVWEWCSTKWQEYGDKYPALKGAAEWTDGYLAGSDGRVIRGGSFVSGADLVRGACRLRFRPAIWGRLRGFRCVLWL